jgi:hypothetical protein
MGVQRPAGRAPAKHSLRTADVIVPEALVPVHCDAEHDHAVYVEPNVWVEHALCDARPDGIDHRLV